jgi:hypothetical protein
MKSIIVASAIVIAIVDIPGVSFACKTDAPVTRAQVRQELVQLEEAGYHPSVSSLHYPDEIQAAQARLTAKNEVTCNSSAYGSSEARGRIISR